MTYILIVPINPVESIIMRKENIEYVFLMFAVIVSALFQGLYFFNQYIFANLIISLYVVYLIYQNRDKQILSKPLFVVLVIFSFIYIGSYFLSKEKISAVEEVLRVLGFLPALVMGFCMGRKRYLYFSYGIIAASTIVAVLGLLVFSGLIQIEGAIYINRLQSTIQYANVAAILFLIAIIYSFRIIESNSIIFLITNIILIISLIFTLSRSVWAISIFVFIIAFFSNFFIKHKSNRLWYGFILGYSFTISFILNYVKGINFLIILLLSILIGIVLEFVKNKEKVYIILTSFLMFSSLIFIFIFNNDIIERIKNINLQSTELHARIAYYKGALNVIKDHPLSGCGVRGWEQVCETYVGVYSKFVHNYYLQIACDTGIGGLITFIIFIVYLIKNRNMNNDNYSFPIIVIILIHSLLDVTMHFQLIAIIFFVACGYITSSKQKDKT
jgi:O-antigen ligase